MSDLELNKGLSVLIFLQHVFDQKSKKSQILLIVLERCKSPYVYKATRR